MKKIILLLVILCNTFISSAWAANGFLVQNIEIQGLQRVSYGTVYSYLPIKRGQTLSSGKTGAIIQSLYRTGFFDHISLARHGNTLVIMVTERPTIGKLQISGNSFIPTDKLTSVMRSMDIAEGHVYNQAIIERIQQSLLNQYYELGRYNARVNVTTVPMPRNRVMVRIDISEGLVAKIRHINIIGNHAFSESTLNKQLLVSTPGVFTIFTQKDRYTQEKLDESLENLRNFYLDHGYIKYVAKSSQVAITPDRKSIYLTIVIDEGEPYCVSGIALAGDTILPHDQIMQFVRVRPGDRFSRQVLVDSEQAISAALGDHGYVFSTVSVEPKVDDQRKTIFLTLNVKPGKRTYVRHIYFTDNSKTNDEVLRREIQQMEAAVISTSKLEQSKHQLSLLPYVKDVQMSVQPVPGSDDQADVNYKVTEDNAAQANVSIGYSQLYRAQIGAGFNQKNFLGTGKTLGVNATVNKYQKYLGINYTNPYYTPDGISRSINLSIAKEEAGNGNLAPYTLNQYDLTVLYGIPLGQEKGAFNRLQLGYGYEDSQIGLYNQVSQQIRNFVNRYGRHFGQAEFVAGLSRDSRDKAIFPTSGALNTIGVNAYLPVVGGLHYYNAVYSGRFYYPLGAGFIAFAKGQLGYGNGFNGPQEYPFFKNFYAGGIDTVRGYLGNTLGPRDSNQKPTGGNELVTGSLAMIFPNYISENFRTSVFVDGGNVYNTFNNRTLGGYATGPIRYSAGLDGAYLTMFGLIEVSVAKPLNRQSGAGKLADNEEVFQFSLGANFG